MKIIKPSFSFVVGLTALLLGVSGQKADEVHEVELACRHQLRVIHEAITYYVEANDTLPPELGDLVGDYIQPGMLLCPAAKTSGETGVDNQGLIVSSKEDGRLWGYKYEFSLNGDFNTNDSRDRVFNWLQFKRKQFASNARDWVPLVRCDKHGDALSDRKHDHLNLSITGKVYSSPIYWEYMYPEIIPSPYLSPDLIEFSEKPLVEYMVPRSLQASMEMVDLRPYCNAMLEHPWIFGGWGQEMDGFSAKYTDGFLRIGDIAFDVPGLIQVQGSMVDDPHKGYTYNAYPEAKMDILIDARFSVIHVLGGVLFSTEPGEVAAVMDLVSDDDEVVGAIKWEYGKDVVSIFSEGRNTSNFQLIWRETVRHQEKQMDARLFHMRFANPAPDVHISKIHFRAGDSPASPFIAGLTWEP